MPPGDRHRRRGRFMRPKNLMNNEHVWDCTCPECQALNAAVGAAAAELIDTVLAEAEQRRQRRREQVHYRAPPDPPMRPGGIRQRAYDAVMAHREQQQSKAQKRQKTISNGRRRFLRLTQGWAPGDGNL